MDARPTLLEKYQLVIDETNEVLARWKATEHTGAPPNHFDVQSLFLSKAKKILFGDYTEYSKVMRMGKPIAYVGTNGRISCVYSNTEYVKENFAKCDYHKEIPGYEPVLESVHSINFNNIHKIKFQ